MRSMYSVLRMIHWNRKMEGGQGTGSLWTEEKGENCGESGGPSQTMDVVGKRRTAFGSFWPLSHSTAVLSILFMDRPVCLVRIVMVILGRLHSSRGDLAPPPTRVHFGSTAPAAVSHHKHKTGGCHTITSQSAPPTATTHSSLHRQGFFYPLLSVQVLCHRF